VTDPFLSFWFFPVFFSNFFVSELNFRVIFFSFLSVRFVDQRTGDGIYFDNSYLPNLATLLPFLSI
jgi:hypothetical protein